MITLALGCLASLCLAVAALVVARPWRVTIPLVLVADLARIGLLRATIMLGTGAGGTMLLIVELVTALGVAAILLLTALTLSHDYNVEQLDEFGLMELRRAARRAQQQRATVVGRWTGTIVPIGAVALAGLATLFLGRAYPIARQPLLDAAWIFSLLCGLLVLVTAHDVLKLGIGLLLVLTSAKLLYFGVATPLNVFHLGLWALASLALAIVVAYLSGLLFGRLRTLEIDSLFERRL